MNQRQKIRKRQQRLNHQAQSRYGNTWELRKEMQERRALLRLQNRG